MADNKNRSEQISELISAGIVGAALGKILTGKKGNTIIWGLVGIAVAATYNAFKASTKSAPVLIIDNGDVFEVDKYGKRKFIKHLPKIDAEIPDTFKIA